MKLSCNHCLQFKECVEVGKWMLCHDDKGLKQYQPKEEKTYQLKRATLNKTYKIKDPPTEHQKKYRIPQKSKKRKKEDVIYSRERKKFLEINKICFVKGCNKEANTIEHIAHRTGYADDWARENGITLYLDQRYWRGCCLEHNLEFERNPELSKQYQLSNLTMKPK